MNRCVNLVWLFAASSCILHAVLSCSSLENETTVETVQIVNVVGEIFADPAIDDPTFKICNPQDEIIQYYAFNEKTYDGEKISIEKTVTTHYRINPDIDESGWLRVRFVVNCYGETGRFRISGMDTHYKKKEFHPHIIKQLLALAKSLDGWKPMEARGMKRDYYQYLLFKIENGKILEILP